LPFLSSGRDPIEHSVWSIKRKQDKTMTFPAVKKASPLVSFVVIVGSTAVLWGSFFEIVYRVSH
jgi:hypothetical protein